MSLEKPEPVGLGSNQSDSSLDLEQKGEREGYVLSAQDVQTRRELKTTSDGQTILIPQPSDSPYDPLNWSQYKKHLVLIVISCTAFLPDYGSATGAVTLDVQAAEWGILPTTVNHSQVGNVFMVGAASPIIVALAAYFGRYPVLFWWTVLALATAIWCTAAQSFNSFMAARILNGMFSTVMQGGGLMFIKDMFFFHEHARKINIWSGFVILSPYMGPMFSAFILTTQTWRVCFGLLTAMTGLCLLAVIFFAEETYYDRKNPKPDLIPSGPRWQRMLGTQQWRTGYIENSFKDAIMRPLIIIVKPVVALSCLFYLLVFAWVVGVNTTLSLMLPPIYGFQSKQIGFFYFTPIVAAILGEVIGHWLHDLIAKIYTNRNQGRLEPEARLFAIWVASPFMIAGLLVMGYALQNHWHYMLTALGWGLYVFGIMVVTVGVNAYVLDSYPEASGEVAAWVNFGRTTGGFIVSYFMIEWEQKQGSVRQFGTMTGIVGFGFIIIAFLQVYGKRLRLWSGPAKFKTA
ncbi:hypothetical protein N7474_007419 [Penicillium riverlandense]|uniref:uncharacterized protein n=1 Tax=Penicillium riverlandense TaxID=1903569 RepID=UPI0025483230|nr:uncharacterized protein N7474_007419 [Penicillium riverlandense]KAJ5815642.1 hypothetical protein N7474_007419 [Penicillium riverlandense]